MASPDLPPKADISLAIYLPYRYKGFPYSRVGIPRICDKFHFTSIVEDLFGIRLQLERKIYVNILGSVITVF